MSSGLRTLSLSLLCFHLILENTESKSKCNRIMGGKIARVGQFPFQAQLILELPYNCSANKTRYCEGTLIHPQWILSAAHCFTSESLEAEESTTRNKFLVYMGTNRAFDPKTVTPPDPKLNELKKVFLHPNYSLAMVPGDYANDYSKIQNDVAVGFLKCKYKLNRFINVAWLPRGVPLNCDFTRRCKVGLLVGNGRSDDGKKSNYMRYSRVTTVNRQTLLKPRPKPCVDTVFYSERCLDNLNVAKGDCGDPFLCFLGIRGIPVQYGIVSTSESDSMDNLEVTIYESVEKHMGFITEHVPKVHIYEGQAIG